MKDITNIFIAFLNAVEFVFQIREETDTKIDLPSENSDSDVIVITGKKANVEQAKAKIEAIQKELVQTVYFRKVCNAILLMDQYFHSAHFHSLF